MPRNDRDAEKLRFLDAGYRAVEVRVRARESYSLGCLGLPHLPVCGRIKTRGMLEALDDLGIFAGFSGVL